MQERYIKVYDLILITLLSLICAAVSVLISVYLRYGRLSGMTTDLLSRFLISTLLVNAAYDFNRDFFRRGRIAELMSAVRQQLAIVGVMILWLYLVHSSGDLSRLVFIYYLLIGTAVSLALRLLFKSFMVNVVRRGRAASRLLVVTSYDRAEEALTNILSFNEWYRQIVGVVLSDRDTAGALTLTQQKIPVVAVKSDLVEYATHNAVDEVFILTDVGDEDIPLISALEEMGIKVDINIDLFDLNVGGKKDLDHIGKYATVSVSRNLYSPRQAIAKRSLDIAGALAGTVVLAIASIVIVPAIKLDSPGPALFKQRRVGKNGRVFTLYKFRTMYEGADLDKDALMPLNEAGSLMFKLKSDPRVTRVGRVLRRTSLDELPQFINVLKGDMSLVGTRPPTVDEYERYEARHKKRLSLKPGITGLWQISGRSEIRDFDEVIALDMNYIDNWSFSRDIAIILKTFKAVVRGTGAR